MRCEQDLLSRGRGAERGRERYALQPLGEGARRGGVRVLGDDHARQRVFGRGVPDRAFPHG